MLQTEQFNLTALLKTISVDFGDDSFSTLIYHIVILTAKLFIQFWFSNVVTEHTDPDNMNGN